VLTYSAVYRCIALIASDVGKMRLRLVQQGADEIWREVANPAFSPVLRKPNRYQNRIQFFSSWVESKLVHGNTYVLKVRDQRNVVVSMHILDPQLVRVLVAPDGAVFYELSGDALAGVPENNLAIPASEIIHDRMSSAFNHPLIGISPIHACGLAATQGLKIQESSAAFFANGSQPSGVITVPTKIQPENAERLQSIWDSRRAGTTAILDNGAQYAPLTMSATDAQLIEQLKMTAETVATAFGVPAFKIGVGNPPTYNNIEALDGQYYSQCLQIHIESIEECLDHGLGLGASYGNNYGTEFDLDGLLRMDTATKVKAAQDAIGSGAMAPNEARMRYFDLGPKEGGDSPFLQQQYYSLAALYKRDQQQGAPPTPDINNPSGSPAEVNADDDGGDDEQPDERQRNVVAIADRLQRRARDNARRSVA
jgi:HK97 family phage portal protein